MPVRPPQRFCISDIHLSTDKYKRPSRASCLPSPKPQLPTSHFPLTNLSSSKKEKRRNPIWLLSPKKPQCTSQHSAPTLLLPHLPIYYHASALSKKEKSQHPTHPTQLKAEKYFPTFSCKYASGQGSSALSQKERGKNRIYHLLNFY